MFILITIHKGSFNSYVDKIRGGGGQKMSVFVHAQSIKTVHAVSICGFTTNKATKEELIKNEISLKVNSRSKKVSCKVCRLFKFFL